MLKTVGKTSAQVFAGLLFAALCGMAQSYTISAKPGAVNYIEGNVSLNGSPVSDKGLKSTFLNTNDTLSTDLGKAEILLTPGVFLRMGDNTQIRMVSPSLTDTQVEVVRGEIMIEATGLGKENSIQVLDHGSITTLMKNGLYRFTADDPPLAAVLDGKADVVFGASKVSLKKGKEAILSADLRAQNFDAKKDDELYAWSNVRSEYEAAASYRVARSASSGNFGGWYGYGFNGMVSPGWLYDSSFGSYAWLPGSGAFYSPFGYGFYSPGLVGYAPVVTAPVYRTGNWGRGQWNHNGTTPANGWHGRGPGNGGVMAAVPVSPNNPAAVGNVTGSPWANRAARWEARRALGAGSGFQDGAGTPAPGTAAVGTQPGMGGWRNHGANGDAGARPNAGAWHNGANNPGAGAGAGHPGNWSGGGGHPGGWSGGGGHPGGWSGGGGHPGGAAPAAGGTGGGGGGAHGGGGGHR